MTDKQKQNLISIANVITTGRKEVSESFAVGQIMLVTGRPYDQAIKGLKLMQGEKVLPSDWIKPETIGVLERMTARNPALEKLFSRFDVIPGKTEIRLFEGFCRPKPVSVEGLKKIFSLPEF